MFFEAQEISIKDQLINYINDANIDIEILPENEKDFTRQLVKPCLSVCYSNSDFDPSLTNNKIGQFETESFDVVIRATKLRGQYGAYDCARLISGALVGFKPTNCERMQAVKFRFDDYSAEHKWRFVFTFSARTLAVQDYTDPAFVPANTVTFNPPL